MSAENIDDLPVLYEQLEDLDYDFEQVDLDIMRIQDKMSRELYAKRAELIAKIPNFWPLVFEEAPPEVDAFVQPTDASIIAQYLKNLSVDRFELPDGHPRSVSIKFEFKKNEFFEDTVIEKKFWWRMARDNRWSGLISEPVPIKWKPGKDLTDGMLDLAVQIHEDDKAGKTDEETDAKKALTKILETTSIDSASFFNFFGYRGPSITEEESREATKIDQEAREARRNGKDDEIKDDEIKDDEIKDDEIKDDNNSEDLENEFEIFPNGEDLAIAISEDLYREAITYFMDGERLAAASDVDFEDDGDENDGVDEIMN